MIAGPDQLVVLPTKAISLSGSVSYDVFPGAVDTVLWSQLSGPGAVSFGAPSEPETTATFSQSGIYRLQLLASDGFLSATDTLTVTVDAPPMVSIGTALTNTFPGTLAVSGFASDDGLPTNGTLSATWSVVSGPGAVVFDHPAATNTTVTFGTNGIYVLRLTASDGIATSSLDVTMVENLPPTVSAGANVLTNGLSALLEGRAGDDGLPAGVLSLQWSQSSGPGSLSFGTPQSASTTVSASQSGTYVLTLAASDGAATNTSEVTLTLNLPPAVDAGLAQTVNLGSPVTLAGAVSDDQWPRNMLTSLWTQVSGPGAATFADATLTNTSVTFDQPGRYTLRLTANDSLASSSADVLVTVHAAPVVDAGANQLVALGAPVTLTGTLADDGLSGMPVTVQWSQVSGPEGAVLAMPNATNSLVSFSQSGVYVFQLTADDGLTNASARVSVTVNQAPSVTVSGGPSPLRLPQVAQLTGLVSDDGLPAGTLSYAWSQVSGPSGLSFSAPNATNTTASFASAGTYTLRLTANDSMASGSGDITLVVQPANQPPLVEAGPAQTNVFPGAVQLAGMAADDGVPAALSTTWSLVEGPGTVGFDHANATNALATFSTNGIYTLRLTASDSELTRSSDVLIVMNAAPVVSAGPDLRVTVGDLVSLAGSVTDDGLPSTNSLTVQWSLVSGNGLLELTSSTDPVTLARFKELGTYVLRLTASDSLATNSADVTVTVLPINRAPVVSAGPKQLVLWPASAILLGYVTDDGLPEGAPLMLTWSKVSGPGEVTFSY